MKRRKTVLVLTAVIGLCSLVLLLGISGAKTFGSANLDEQNLGVRISPLKNSYVQGEVVALDVEISNNGQSDVFLKGSNVESGFVKIFIAGEDQKFKQYSHSAWIRDRRGDFIKPGQTIKSQATLLWNFKPQVSHLNEDAARNASEGLILTDYAFNKPGTYVVKAVLIIPGETQIRIESEPVQIVIEAPTGEDLKVWNLIKDNGEIAYFIQEGAVRSPKPEEQEKVQKEIEQLTSSYPNGLLASQIRQSLDKFRVSDAKRKEFMEKRKKQKSEN